MSVVVEHIPTNKNCRIFHFREPITGHAIWHRHSGWSFDEHQSPTLRLLTEVHGVESFLLNTAYSLMVSRGRAYEWEEIEPKVVSILEMHDYVPVSAAQERYA